MVLRLMINRWTLLLAAGVFISCSGPKALIHDQSGTVIPVKKIRFSDGHLLFRFSGGSIETTFQKLGSFKVDPSVREIYAGETWISAEMSLKKDKSASIYKGWVRQLGQLKGSTTMGKCELDMVNLKEIDFFMGKKKTDTKKVDTAKSDTLSKPAGQ